MRVKIVYDVGPIVRRAFNYRFGLPGLASRKDILAALESLLEADVETIVSEMDEQAPEERMKIEAKEAKLKLRRELRELGEEISQNEVLG